MRHFRLLAISSLVLTLAASCNPFGVSGGGGGLLKSVDSGESWDFANKLEAQGTIAGVTATRIRIDRNKSDQLYLGTSSSGVYSSADRGIVWKQILAGPKIFDLQVNPGNSEEIFAGGSFGDVAKAFRSGDGGQSWVEAYSEAKGSTFVSAVAYHPSDNKIIYLGLSSGEIVRSANGGETWNLFTRLNDRIVRIEVEPEDARLMYALNFMSGLWRSTDGGGTWQQVTDKISARNFHDFRTVRGSPSSLYLATGDGLWHSSNRGETWTKLQLPLHEPTSIVSSVELNQRAPAHLFATVGQTLYISSDGGNFWKTKALSTSATVRDLVLDQNETNVMYAALGVPMQ
ncbi:MAG: hypothetical protein A2722_01905 [Candidatus Doudnabacteria bacterium RIFCSPHIGHO2_01_FULL_50_11]|uniref:Sortilin N-terminal domain-containing protein n=1 Tax=Candidatus Doudnabacteria bacterium RIFCSPHIGHO2_01_FULL_50_11 TaxID=1817828 RepID=A0A1F5PMR8_9BACT|nr:MAG: hypothetical protein A2722_01905 [Candidatus Doudnabacteria bacterium RIFCSPHIGHO2_01_FULL_50_11]HLC44469.1 YCF48-related protein [Patescibacteria group bacterium]